MTDLKELRPKVGIGVMVFKEGKVLLGKRKNSHGSGEYAWPGGHLEFNESMVDCAIREVKEETGVEIQNVKFLRLMNFKLDPKHYADISFTADWKAGVAQTLEPEKCEGWEWYNLDSLPSPLFGTIQTTLEAYKTGKVFFDF